MVKLHELVSDEKFEEEPKIRESDQLRKKIEDADINIDKPLDQWSEVEKNKLRNLLNNFYMKVPGGALTNRKTKGLKPESFDMLTKEKYSPEDLAGIMNGPAEWRFSEKYLNESQRQLQENIKQALISNGLDMEKLQEKRTKGDKNLIDWINLNSLPAIFDLLDEGYTIYDLTI